MPKAIPLSLLVFVQTVVSAASLVVEIVAGRMLAPHVGMSLYTWTSIIAVVLLAIGNPIWAITAISTLVFFLPSLFAGVPAPVLAKIAISGPGQSGPALGAIFAAGAIGAIAGTLLAGFLFISWLGSAATLAAVTLAYVLTAELTFWMAGGVRLLLPLLVAGAAIALAGMALARPGQCDVESQYY